MVSDSVAHVKVEVVHASSPAHIWRRVVDVPEGATVRDAIRASGVLEYFPELEGPLPPVGIFGRLCSPEQGVQPDDRVELYRPLVFDPMESRRRRLLHRQRQAEGQGGTARRKPAHSRQKPA